LVLIILSEINLMRNLFFLIFSLFFSLNLPLFADHKINLKALFNNQIMLQIDGKNRVIKAGKTSPEGFKLISASSKKAVIEFKGKKMTLNLNRSLSVTSFYSKTQPNTRPLVIPYIGGHYRIKGFINTKMLSFLIDTGATTVAISRDFAKRAHIKIPTNPSGSAKTANGVVDVYSVTLKRIKIGNIELRNVQASILPNLTGEALLGMSFLKHTNFSVKNNKMILTKKH